MPLMTPTSLQPLPSKPAALNAKAEAAIGLVEAQGVDA
jgi:hypothetical protein